MRTSPYINNSLFISSLLVEKNISMGTWELIKLGKFPQHNGLGFFCWGRDPSKYT
jgi:hypothetical protein